MKVTVARGGRLAGEPDPVMQQDVLKQELIRQGQTENLSLFLSLGELLRQQIPASLLAAISFEQVVADLVQAGLFLLQRDKDIKVVLQPQQQAGHYFLFTNAPDANHIFSSIQEFFHRRSLHFRVICHPILSVRRENGLLSEVTEGDPELDQESFVWLEFDQLPMRLLAELQEGLERIIGAALWVNRDQQQIQQLLGDLSELDNLKQYTGLLDWLREENFIAVASRSYRFTAESIVELEDQAHGLRKFYQQPFDVHVEPVALPLPTASLTEEHGSDVILDKTELRCPLHRFERLSTLTFRQPIDADNFMEHTFWGFYTQQLSLIHILTLPTN